MVTLPSNWKIYAGIAVLVIALALVFPYASQYYARVATEREITSLQDRLAAISVQGGDPVEADALQARIRQLTATADSYGSDIELADVTLSGCDAKRNRINSEAAHYVQVSYSDPAQRESSRGAMLSYGHELYDCYGQAIADAETRTTLDNVRRSLVAAIKESEARRVNWEAGAAGWDRYGVSEPHGFDKAAAERDQTQAGLRRAYAALIAKMGTLAA